MWILQLIIQIYQMKKEPQSRKQYYQQLKSELLEGRQFPNVSKMLNLSAFIKENQALFARLSKELVQLKNSQKRQQKNIKIKTTPFYLNNNTQSMLKEEDKLKEIKARNQYLQSVIAAQRTEEDRRRKQQIPLLKQKKQQLKQKEAERQKMIQLNKQLKKALQTEDMLQLYQYKCRQCESLRKINNAISEQIKSMIKEINQLTGSDENPNMFFMNLRV